MSTNGGEEPRWASDRRLFFRRDDTLLGVDIAAGDQFAPGTPCPAVQGIFDLRSDTGISYDIDRRTGRFLMLRPESDERPASSVRVVLNWFQELQWLTGDK